MQILKLKDGVDVESLRKYGFKTGKEWAAQGERCFLPEVPHLGTNLKLICPGVPL